MGRRYTRPMRLNPKEVRTPENASLTTESKCLPLRTTLLAGRALHALSSPRARFLLLEDRNGQTLASLATAVRENLRAATGRHAREEAVRTETAGVVGLVSALGLCHDVFRFEPIRSGAHRRASHSEGPRKKALFEWPVKRGIALPTEFSFVGEGREHRSFSLSLWSFPRLASPRRCRNQSWSGNEFFCPHCER